MACPRRLGVLTSGIAGTLLFHPPQVDDLGHAGKVARMKDEDEMEDTIERAAGDGYPPC